MTEQIQTKFPQFYLTVPSPCPYLADRSERKVFTQLHGHMARPLNDALTHAGFRRSQNIAYKPACESCSACVSVRIVVDQFKYKSSFRRISKRNLDVKAEVVSPIATEEQYSVLRAYLDTRHSEGGMADMTILDYASMVEDSAVKTYLVEYRLIRAPSDPEHDRLVGVALTDRLGDGISMVYSFFLPEFNDRSLGSHMILDHVGKASSRGLPYVYLGYWVEGSPKMHYKMRFQPLERLGPNGWEPMASTR